MKNKQANKAKQNQQQKNPPKNKTRPNRNPKNLKRTYLLIT